MEIVEGFLLIMIGLGVVMIGWAGVRMFDRKPFVKVIAILLILVAAIHSFIPGFETLIPGFVPEGVRWPLAAALSFALISGLMFMIVLNPRVR